MTSNGIKDIFPESPVKALFLGGPCDGLRLVGSTPPPTVYEYWGNVYERDGETDRDGWLVYRFVRSIEQDMIKRYQELCRLAQLPEMVNYTQNMLAQLHCRATD